MSSVDPASLPEACFRVAVGYKPSPAEPNQLQCNLGDCIRVKCRDASGWTYGVLLQNGGSPTTSSERPKRGWFPNAILGEVVLLSSLRAAEGSTVMGSATFGSVTPLRSNSPHRSSGTGQVISSPVLGVSPIATAEASPVRSIGSIGSPTVLSPNVPLVSSSVACRSESISGNNSPTCRASSPVQLGTPVMDRMPSRIDGILRTAASVDLAGPVSQSNVAFREPLVSPVSVAAPPEEEDYHRKVHIATTLNGSNFREPLQNYKLQNQRFGPLRWDPCESREAHKADCDSSEDPNVAFVEAQLEQTRIEEKSLQVAERRLAGLARVRRNCLIECNTADSEVKDAENMVSAMSQLLSSLTEQERRCVPTACVGRQRYHSSKKLESLRGRMEQTAKALMQAEICLDDAVDRAALARQQFRVAQAEATEALEVAGRQRERAKAAVINAVQASGWNSEELGLPRARWRTPPRNERTEVASDADPSSQPARQKSSSSRGEHIEKRLRHRLGPRPQLNGASSNYCQSSNVANSRSHSATPKMRRSMLSSQPMQSANASYRRTSMEEEAAKVRMVERARSASPGKESRKIEEEVLEDADLRKAISLVHELEDIQAQWKSIPDWLREPLAQRFDLVRRLLQPEQ